MKYWATRKKLSVFESRVARVEWRAGLERNCRLEKGGVTRLGAKGGGAGE